MLSFIYTFTSKLPLLLVANMQVSHTAMMLFLLHNNASSNAASVTEILSTMAEKEDSNNKIHELSRTLKKAQLQEERSLDEIAEDKVDKKNEKADADTGVLAQVGTPCVYSNGTQGIKCVGEGACTRRVCSGYYYCYDEPVDIDRIACGSCIGDESCYGLYNTDVGEQSCIGLYSCLRADNASIGNNSCHGDYSCQFADNASIGNNSCNGYGSCRFVDDAEIGSNSCNGYKPCDDADNVEIGNNSCVGEQSCYEVGRIYSARIKIGNNSCIKDYACIDVYYDVGQDSCAATDTDRVA